MNCPFCIKKLKQLDKINHVCVSCQKISSKYLNFTVNLHNERIVTAYYEVYIWGLGYYRYIINHYFAYNKNIITIKSSKFYNHPIIDMFIEPKVSINCENQIIRPQLINDLIDKMPNTKDIKILQKYFEKSIKLQAFL